MQSSTIPKNSLFGNTDYPKVTLEKNWTITQKSKTAVTVIVVSDVLAQSGEIIWNWFATRFIFESTLCLLLLHNTAVSLVCSCRSRRPPGVKVYRVILHDKHTQFVGFAFKAYASGPSVLRCCRSSEKLPS